MFDTLKKNEAIISNNAIAIITAIWLGFTAVFYSTIFKAGI